MEQIHTEARTSQRRYRLVAIGLAAALLVVAGAVAVYVGSDVSTDDTPSNEPMREPDAPVLRHRTVPDAAEAVLATRNVSGEVAAGGELAPFEEGFWAGLDAETVLCVGRERSGVTQVMGLPFKGLLTEEQLIVECASGNWAEQYGQTDAFIPEDATACVDYLPAAHDEAGETVPDDYPRAVVALEGLTCAQTAVVNTSVGNVRDLTDEDLAQLNRMRAIEVALLANPEPCPTIEEAEAWAEARLAEEGVEVSVGGEVTDGGDNIVEESECWQPAVWWDDIENLNLAKIIPPTETP